jgi:hypothetical protein
MPSHNGQAQGRERALIRMGRVPQPTQAQVHTFTTLNMVVLLVDALVGVMILRGRWRQALALEHA